MVARFVVPLSKMSHEALTKKFISSARIMSYPAQKYSEYTRHERPRTLPGDSRHSSSRHAPTRKSRKPASDVTWWNPLAHDGWCLHSLTPAMCSTDASLLRRPNRGNTAAHGVFVGSISRLVGHTCKPAPPTLPPIDNVSNRCCTPSTVFLMACYAIKKTARAASEEVAACAALRFVSIPSTRTNEKYLLLFRKETSQEDQTRS